MSEEKVVKNEEMVKKPAQSNDSSFNVHGDMKDVAQLILSVSKVMGNVKPIAKEGYNSKDDYDYLQAEDCLNEVRPLLAKENIALLSSVKKVNIGKDNSANKVLVDVEFKLISGETGAYIDFVYTGYAHDYSDKFLYKAYTNAIKYALKNNFMLSSGNMVDVELDTYEEEEEVETLNETVVDQEELEKRRKEKEELAEKVKEEKLQKAKEAQAKKKKQSNNPNASNKERDYQLDEIRRSFSQNRDVVLEVVSEYFDNGKDLENLKEAVVEDLKEINNIIEKRMAELEEEAN